MALLRNLRNILQSGVGDEVLTKAASIIGDKNRVRSARVMPVRFLSAYKEINETANSSVFLEALEKGNTVVNKIKAIQI